LTVSGSFCLSEDELDRIDTVALQMNLSPLNSNKKLDIPILFLVAAFARNNICSSSTSTSGTGGITLTPVPSSFDSFFSRTAS
jgi:hypothetical protein